MEKAEGQALSSAEKVRYEVQAENDPRSMYLKQFWWNLRIMHAGLKMKVKR